jgi:hypothetical protein
MGQCGRVSSGEKRTAMSGAMDVPDLTDAEQRTFSEVGGRAHCNGAKVVGQPLEADCKQTPRTKLLRSQESLVFGATEPARANGRSQMFADHGLTYLSRNGTRLISRSDTHDSE